MRTDPQGHRSLALELTQSNTTFPTTQDSVQPADLSQITIDNQLTPQTCTFPSFLLDTDADVLNPSHLVANSVREDLKLPEPDFQWGERDGNTFSNPGVHWRRNVFMIPSGKARKSFIRDLATIYKAYVDVLMHCTEDMYRDAVQKPHAKCKAKNLLFI